MAPLTNHFKIIYISSSFSIGSFISDQEYLDDSGIAHLQQAQNVHSLHTTNTTENLQILVSSSTNMTAELYSILITPLKGIFHEIEMNQNGMIA